MKGGCTHSAQGGGMASLTEGGGGHRAGLKGVIPPPPQLKKGRGPPYPTPRPGERDPPPRYPLGHPPPRFSALVYVGETITSFAQIWRFPPTPHCLRPAVGTPCHLFCAWDPPSPPAQKGLGSLDPTTRVMRPYPHPRVPRGHPSPFSGRCFTSETCLHPVLAGSLGGGYTCSAG